MVYETLKDKVTDMCVDGLLVKNGKMLLLKRAGEPFKGCWGLVGGSVEAGETLMQALKREFKEEIGLDVEVGRLIDTRIENTFDRTKKIFTFEVTGAKGEIKLSSESESYGWFDRVPENSVFDYGKFLSAKVRAQLEE
jgi:8-oxo-dGTP diphosphatase